MVAVHFNSTLDVSQKTRRCCCTILQGVAPRTHVDCKRFGLRQQGQNEAMAQQTETLDLWGSTCFFVGFFFLVLICKVFIQQYADHLYWPLCYLHVRASTLNASRISGISWCLYQNNPKYARWVKCRRGGLVNFAAAKIVAYRHCEYPEISPYVYAVFLRFSTFFLLSILGCKFMSILLATWVAKRSSPFVRVAEACFVFLWRQTYLHGSKSLKYVRLLSTKLCW